MIAVYLSSTEVETDIPILNRRYSGERTYEGTGYIPGSVWTHWPILHIPSKPPKADLDIPTKRH